MTLPSNASMGIFPDNNPTKFSIKLPQTIELNSQYEVGLAEIQFPNSYFNVLEDDVWIHYYLSETTENDIRKHYPPVLVTLPAGLYESIEDFVNEMNTALMAKDGVIKIVYNKASKRAGVRLYTKDIEVSFSDTLKDILMLPSSHMRGNQPEMEGTDMADVNRDMKNIYVYADIATARCVGDTMVPLLRSVPILDRTSTSVFRIYDKPHYVPLSRFSFDTVEIHLTNDKGKRVPFTTGTSVVTLHFRQRNRFDLN